MVPLPLAPATIHRLSPRLTFAARPLALLFVAFFSVLLPGAQAAINPANGDRIFTAKELRQGYRDDVVLAQPRAAHRATVDAEESGEGTQILHRFERFGGLRAIVVESGETVEEAITRLRATGRYEFVEPDQLRYAQATPNDPEFRQLWGLANTGQINGAPGADIKAPAAWDIRRDAPGVIVAVIDSGINLTHTDIAPNLWRNPSLTPGFNDLNGARFTSANGRMTSGDPSDDAGHGTHVAGTIGAVGNNGIGSTGVAWNVQLMALKFLTAAGTGSSSDSIACIDYAIAHGAHIINASYGNDEGTPINQSELAAIRRARDAGIIFVAAAGNQTANLDITTHYPSSLPVDNIVSVGASTRLDDIAVFSNFGSAVDLFAPGNDILSLDHTLPNGGTKMQSGTSMAAPHVTGAIALLKAQFPSDNYRQLINRLLRSVDVGPSFAGRAQTNGRLNLLKALTSTNNRPFNDTFAERPRHTSENLAIRSSNAGATADPGEPAHANNPATASLWWEWVATGATSVTVNTTGSAYDTTLAIYTLNPDGSFTPVVSNDNDGANTTSSVTFTSQPGMVYQVCVDGKSGATGATFLNLNATPANDNFASATVLTGVSARASGTNARCTREANEPRILGNAGGTSLWYRWTAPSTGRFQVSVYTADFDSLLAIYTGSSLDSLTLVTANDNTGFDNSQRPSLCTLDATAGTTYYFTLDAKPGTGGASNIGSFTLTLVDSIWQASTGTTATTGASVTGSSTVAPDGTIYVGGTDRALYALRPDGSLKWRFATTGGPNNAGGLIDTASPALGTDGTIYVGHSGGRFFALTPDGGVRWTRDFALNMSASITPAIAEDGTIYLKVGDGFLYALDPANGATKWSYDIKAPSSYASPVIARDGTIYQGSDDEHLYAFNPDGTLKWRFHTETNGAVYGTPAIDAAGNLYFGVLNSGRFYSVTPAGTQRWVYTGSFESISSSAALSTDSRTVYFGSYDRRLYALDTATGESRWIYQLANQVRASSPAIDANGRIYIGVYDNRIYAVNSDGTLARVYDTGNVVRSSPVIFGSRLYVGSNDRKVYAFDLPTGGAGGPWPQYRNNPRHIGRALDEPFAIVLGPRSRSAALGQSLTLSLSATGNNPLSYQWFKDGVAIASATSSTLTIANVTAATSGSYTATVTSPQGTLTSEPALILAEPLNPGRLINLSVRTNAGTGAQTLALGFVVSGMPPKPLLVRGIGPGLAPFGVTDALANPQLQLVSGSAIIASNDNWGGSATLANAAASVGAFALPATSLDAALLHSVETGGVKNYSVLVTGVGGTTGIALAELYDTEPTSPATTTALSRLINLSARAQVANGSGVLIAGFTISGNVSRQVLIRGVGPTLNARFGVADAIVNPRLELFDRGVRIYENDDWGGATSLTTAFNQVGAFAFSSTTSRDAALVITLPPGSYSAQLSGVNNTTGVGLIEVYELP